MAVTPNSFIDYVATANQTVFPVVVARISNEHIRVFQNGAVLTLTTDYVISNTSVTLVVPASTDDLIRIQRDTPQAARVVDFLAGANIVEQDLDNSALQMLYLAQEMWDQVLQLRDQPTVEIRWEGLPQPPLSTLPDWDQNADTRRTPRTILNIVSSQPWVRVDIPNKEVLFAPGKYRIDVNQLFKNQNGGADSLIVAGICNDQDDAGSLVHFLIVNDRPYGNMGTLGGFALFNFTVETALTFKVAVSRAGGSFNMELPRQWIVTRLGGDPELN